MVDRIYRVVRSSYFSKSYVNCKNCGPLPDGAGREITRVDESMTQSPGPEKNELSDGSYIPVESDDGPIRQRIQTESDEADAEMSQCSSEEENIYNACIGTWTDRESDAEKCETCGTAIGDHWSCKNRINHGQSGPCTSPE
jgi:hypothetical protein